MRIVNSSIADSFIHAYATTWHRADLADIRGSDECVAPCRSTVQWSSLVVNGSVVLELDPVQGRLQPFLDDSPWHAGTQVELDAGGARLLLLQTHHTGEALSRSLR
eukprot:SAG11_NODE_840_length_6909_cov_27.081057_7_plen_106_part_00